MGLQRKNFACGLWARGKTYKSDLILQGASHHQYRTSEFISGKLINWLSFYLNFSGKSLKFPIFVIRLLTMFFWFEENIQLNLYYYANYNIKIEFSLNFTNFSWNLPLKLDLDMAAVLPFYLENTNSNNTHPSPKFVYYSLSCFRI